MRFEFYHAGLAGVPKLSVDGTVDDSSVHLSHWAGNRTPPSLRADTSTEIALNFVGAPDRGKLARGLEVVTNNHFDTDGLLSVWTVLEGERALELKGELVAAAEAGDFSEFPNERAVRASITIQGSDNPVAEGVASPLARSLAGDVPVTEARAYELLLPRVRDVLTNTERYEELWRAAWDEIASALESFARGTSKVTEDAASRLSVVALAPELYGGSGFKATRHAAPYTAIAHHARGELYLVALPMEAGWGYRVDYPYYSWAETTVRPRVARRDLAPLVERLNELEPPAGEGRWKLDESELSSAAKFAGADNLLRASRLAPERVAEELRAALLGAPEGSEALKV